MGFGISKKAIVLMLVLVSLRSFATDTDPQDTSTQVTSAMETMHEEKADLSVNGEVAALDKDEYEETERQAITEYKKLDQEIHDLDHQVARLNKGAEDSRTKALIASKKLQLRQQQRADIAKKLALAERSKKVADSQNTGASQRLQAMEQRVEQLRQKNKEAHDGIMNAEKQNRDLKLRLDKAKRALAVEQKRRDTLKAKHTRVSQDGRRLKNELNHVAKM